MPTEKELHEDPAESPPDRETADALTLVDYFDQMDRDAFRRALEFRDSVYPVFYSS